MKTGIFWVLLIVSQLSGFGALRKIPALYDGFPFFDRWGGCYFVGSNGADPVSQKKTEALLDYAGQYISINVSKIYFVENPGAVRLDELTSEGRLKQDPAWLGLFLQAIPNGPQDFSVKLEARNLAADKVAFSTDSFHLIVLQKKVKETKENKLAIFAAEEAVFDGPSWAPVEGFSLSTSNDPVARAQMRQEITWGSRLGSLKITDFQPGERPDGTENMTIPPQSTGEVTIACHLSEGEYQFLAIYTGYKQTPILSSSVSVNVAQDGTCQVIPSAASTAPNYSQPNSVHIERVNGEMTSVTGLPPGTIIKTPATGKSWRVLAGGKLESIAPAAPPGK